MPGLKVELVALWSHLRFGVNNLKCSPNPKPGNHCFKDFFKQTTVLAFLITEPQQIYCKNASNLPSPLLCLQASK